MKRSLPLNLGDLIAGDVDADVEVLIDLRDPASPARFCAGDLRGAVSRFASGLAEAGIEPGDRVAFLSANRWELLVSYLGTMCCGAVAVPVNHKLSPDTVDHILNDADVSLVLFDDDRRAMIPPTVPAIGFDTAGGADFEKMMKSGQLEAYQPAQNDLAEILYTSGSTGVPKGVPLTHQGQLWALGEYLEEQHDDPFRRSTIIVAPMYHMNALFFVSSCLLNRIRIILMPVFDCSRFLDATVEFRCELLTGVPTMFAMVASLPAEIIDVDRSFVKTISIGSAPLSAALLERIQAVFPEAEVSNGYGSTEAGPAVFGPHPGGLPRPALSIGYPRSGVEWRLVDGETPDQGRLLLRTPAMTSGYLNRPDATRDRFVDGWFDTGDIMRRDEHGFMYFVSRADDMFVCGGENVYPSQVEMLLMRHPAVRDTVVVGAPDDIKGAVPVAFVISDGEEADEASLKAYCLSKGPAYAHPRRIIFKTHFPIGGTHKIDRRELEREAETLMVDDGRFTRHHLLHS